MCPKASLDKQKTDRRRIQDKATYGGLRYTKHMSIQNIIGLVEIYLFCRSEKEGVRLMNPHIQDMEEDVLYHLALGSGSHDLQQMFGDVKFVCMGGTPQRMKSFAEYMLGQLGYLLPTGTSLMDISERSHR